MLAPRRLQDCTFAEASFFEQVACVCKHATSPVYAGRDVVLDATDPCVVCVIRLHVFKIGRQCVFRLYV